MAGERTPDTSPTNQARSSDDDISLREHMQRQLDSQQRSFEHKLADLRDLLDQRFAAQQAAVQELKTTTHQRFESVNEFRAQLNDQARLFMGRDESISRHERNAETMAANGIRHDNEMRLMRERFDVEVKQMRDRHEADVAAINSRLDLTQGKSTGGDKALAALFAGASLLVAIMAAVIAVFALN